jgi:hypothetical protein
MFHYFYATTKDKKGGIHQYKLRQGDPVPRGHEITGLAVADTWKFADLLSNVDLPKVYNAAGPRKGRKRTKKNASA